MDMEHIIELKEETVRHYEERHNTKVLFYDGLVMVVSKPPKVITMPPSETESLQQIINVQLPSEKEIKMVHRLDYPTSGLLIGTSDKIREYFINLFKKRQVKKFYVGLTDHKPKYNSRSIQVPLYRDDEKMISSVSTHADLLRRVPHVQYALTDYWYIDEVEQDRHRLYLILYRIYTGRTHQIRVHSTNAKFPLFGDPLYGGTKHTGFFLHALYLNFSYLNQTRSFLVYPDWVPEDCYEQIENILRKFPRFKETPRCMHNVSHLI